MTIRFAAARRGDNSIVARMLSAAVPLRAANDNGRPFTEDMVLRAALRHFAEYGLGAAEHASRNASAAFFAGDRAAYQWWLAICRALDRRMAAAVAARAGG